MSEHERSASSGSLDRVRRLATLAYRKAIYRRADFIVCGATVRDHREPTTPSTLTFAAIGPDGFDEVLGASPHLAKKDIDYFHTVDARLVVARCGTELAAMNWFVRGPGEVWISELRRFVTLGAGEHYSCRTYVDPAFRGQALSAHMKCHYSRDLGPNDRIWAIVMTRNRWSLRSLSLLGWQATGTWLARVRFGCFSAYYEAHEPRPIPA